MSFQLDSLPKVGQSVLGYPRRLLSRTEVAKDTLAFQFQRPRSFLFRPGQFIDLALRGASGNGPHGLTHTFSIASSCFAADIVGYADARLCFQACSTGVASWQRSQHTRTNGSFILHNDVSRPAVLLAGGIGVAPFLSMLSSAAIDKSHPPVFLFYANRYVEDAAFLDTLWECQIETFILSQLSLVLGQDIVDGREQQVPSERSCFPNMSIICKTRSTTARGRQARSQELTKG
jgi:ferredoxin-NADP reductase